MEEAVVVDKRELARSLGEEASLLADVKGANQVKMGLIALRFKEDPELVELDGARNYDQWMRQRFGKKRKTAYRARAVVEKLLLGRFATEERLMDLGSVRAYELSRLPESELRKDEWWERANTLNTATFKAEIARFLENRPDHIEEQWWLHMALPLSMKEVVQQALNIAAFLEESDSKSVLLEAIFSEYIVSHQDEVPSEAISDTEEIEGE